MSEMRVLAQGLMFPEGVMWRDGSLYDAAPPSIWKLTDTDGDGVADQRVEWFQGKTLTGCANDLHGPYPGPDGWIYWCKGAFAPQTYELPGKGTFKTDMSGNTVIDDFGYRTTDPASGAERWLRALGRTCYAPDGTPAR